MAELKELTNRLLPLISYHLKKISIEGTAPSLPVGSPKTKDPTSPSPITESSSTTKLLLCILPVYVEAPYAFFSIKSSNDIVDIKSLMTDDALQPLKQEVSPSTRVQDPETTRSAHR
jgi:hypothetical protein